MKITKMYYEAKSLQLAFATEGVILFFLSFYVEQLFLKICIYILSLISLYFMISIIYKLFLLKREIKKDIVVARVINIEYISDITGSGGYRQNFQKYYYGIKIRTKKKTYLYFYKNVLHDDSQFDIYNKLSKQKKIKIVVYKKSNVIKKILTNM